MRTTGGFHVGPLWPRYVVFQFARFVEIRVITTIVICFVIGLQATVLLVVIRFVQSESDLT